MTGFSTARGAVPGLGWAWELRGVNARGFDLRLRLPDGVEGLEALVRGAVAKRVARGNLSLTLRLQRDVAPGAARLDAGALAGVLDALATVTAEAALRGLTLAPASPDTILSLRGVMDAAGEADIVLTAADLRASLGELLEAFAVSRAAEGAEMAGVLARLLETVVSLLGAAREAVDARRADTEQSFREALNRVVANADGVDADRVAQELAIMAVKADVTEELDRLDAHVKAAGALIGADGPVGRKLDFLMQEFNREANTLCSKSGYAALTRIGLDLKAVIDQMREQVQNLE